MTFYYILLCILLNQLFTIVLCDSFYSITAPGLMKSNRKYTVAVAVHNVQESCSIRIAIEGLSFNASQQFELNAFESKLIEFYPPKLFPGAYKLVAEGIKGLRFKNESVLLIESEAGPKIYIQTDKAVYKPQDLVQFRVVILDEHTRPLNIREPVRVDILDHHGNRIKQFKDINLIKGVYTGKFQLSQRPVMGVWSIRVRISGKYAFESTKLIQVKKYILPKFSVYIQSSKYLTLKDEIKKIKAIIFGKYTYGNFVEGNATIELWDDFHEILLQTKTLQVKAPAAIELPLESVQDLYGLLLFVSLTDKYSGTTQSNKLKISLRINRYDIQVPWEEMEFRNNKPYRLNVHIQHWTGAPVLDHKTPVILLQGPKEHREFLDKEGVATFEIDYQEELIYKLIFNDSQIQPNLFAESFKSGLEYCKLNIIGERPSLERPIQIEVTSIDFIPYLVYVIVGHGNIIRMEYVRLPEQQKSYIINITASIEMVPEAFIYVYFIQNGNYRSDEIKMKLPPEFENKISISAPKQLRPGQQVTINLNAQPGSYVSILAVDMGVYLLNPTYDLNRNDILHDLMQDRSYIKWNGKQLPPGIISGLIVLSNANYVPSENKTDVEPFEKKFGDFEFRQKFPETWIFENLEVNSSKTQLTFNLPDTITTWRITAFSINDIKGFGIVDRPTDIIAKQPFFISINLPFSVKLGEVIVLSATVFNYLNKSVYSEIILFNKANEFQFMEASIDHNNQMCLKQVNVSMNKGAVVKFSIKPLKVGVISLNFTATNELYRDAVAHKLKVEAGGVTLHHNQAVYANVVDNETLTSNFSLQFPSNTLSYSEYITLRVGGDYLMPSLENLDKLVDMPTGCGEQNMINFAPSVLVLQLLKATGKYLVQRDLVAKVKSFIEIGYQQQLSYRHHSGGYSVFGENSESEESTWLTAYVVRFFIKASKYIPIETRIIESGLEYLSKQQLDDGSFPYTGYLLMPAQEDMFAMTAFVILTFLENRKYSIIYSHTIERALQFLNSNVDDIDDIYALSIIATALKAAKSIKANNLLEKLHSLSKENEQGHKWWSANDESESNEKDVEITAYILMAMLDTPGEHLPILKWLIGKRNERGGFQSTHDTVVGLQALLKFSEKLQDIKDTSLTLTYKATDELSKEVYKGEFILDADNVKDLQIHELPRSTRFLNFTYNGTGSSLVQLSYQYNILNETNSESSFIKAATNKTFNNVQRYETYFIIEPKAIMINSVLLEIEICFTYQPQHKQNFNNTNMVIMEVNLPTGFQSDAESSIDLLDNDLIERIESQNDETTIILYFDSLILCRRQCITLDGEKTNEVVEFQPVAIKMYDYYNASRSNVVFYNLN